MTSAVPYVFLSPSRSALHYDLRSPTPEISHRADELIKALAIGERSLDCELEVTTVNPYNQQKMKSIMKLSQEESRYDGCIFETTFKAQDSSHLFFSFDREEKVYSRTQVSLRGLEDGDLCVVKTDSIWRRVNPSMFISESGSLKVYVRDICENDLLSIFRNHFLELGMDISLVPDEDLYESLSSDLKTYLGKLFVITDVKTKFYIEE